MRKKSPSRLSHRCFHLQPEACGRYSKLYIKVSHGLGKGWCLSRVPPTFRALPAKALIVHDTLRPSHPLPRVVRTAQAQNGLKGELRIW
jgi:hypothetical protein